MSKEPKNESISGALANFHQQFNTLPTDLKIMIALAGLNGTTTAIVNSYITASTIAAVRELDLIQDPLVKSNQETIIISTLELSRSKLSKPS